MPSGQRYKAARKASLISALTNSLLAVFKVLFGIIGHSQALVADGLHSFSDLLSDGLVLIAAKAGERHPDKEHPYGHQRIETMVAIVIAFILLAVGGAIIYEMIHDLIHHTHMLTPSIPVLIVAFVSILANEALYRYMLHVGTKVHSTLLIVNAWHNRSDAMTSIIVLLSAIGALLGYHFLDTVGALVIAFFIIKMGTKMIWNSIQELIDAGVNEEKLLEINQHISKTAGVESIHQLRTRMHGGSIFVDVHIIVNETISVSEGHYIGERVMVNLYDGVDGVSDVTVHVDPEDDESNHPCIHLPNRREIEKQLRSAWQDLSQQEQIQYIQLHYLNGTIQADVYFSAETKLDTLLKEYKKAVHNLDVIKDVRFFLTQPSA